MTERDAEQVERAGRECLLMKGRLYVYVSNDPREERIVELTEDYRGADGRLLIPEILAWDGVETCPGVFLEEAE